MERCGREDVPVNTHGRAAQGAYKCVRGGYWTRFAFPTTCVLRLLTIGTDLVTWPEDRLRSVSPDHAVAVNALITAVGQLDEGESVVRHIACFACC